MKAPIKSSFLLSVLIIGLGLIPGSRLMAQTFTTLHSFTGSDGATPFAGLVLSSNTLYGTALAGGLGFGTVFKLNTDGMGFTNLYSFTGGTDGANPYGSLVLSSNLLYGTESSGGSSSNGTVFRLNTDGTGFTNLYSFEYQTYRISGLLLSSNILYGTTDLGGNSGSGSVFALNTDGEDFRILHSFDPFCNCFPTTNNGAYPLSELILSGSTLYGITGGGGTSLGGILFKLNADGIVFTNLHNFSNNEGGDSNAGLVLSGNILYGQLISGGSLGYGTVFAITTDGTDFKKLHSFTGGSDGSFAGATLLLSGSTLYGTTEGGGASGKGSVFKVNTDGTGFTTLYSFTGGSDGGGPWSSLVLSDNTLYGTAADDGTSGKGTVFSIFIQPQLTIIPSRTNVVLTWPTNYSGFILQSAANLVSPVWTTNSPAPVVINGQNTVTNAISGSQQFFRLSL